MGLAPYPVVYIRTKVTSGPFSLSLRSTLLRRVRLDRTRLHELTTDLGA